MIDLYVHVKWFDGEQVLQIAADDDNTVMEHNDNGEEDKLIDDKGIQDEDSNGNDDDMDDQD